jgi:hypothetical protein
MPQLTPHEGAAAQARPREATDDPVAGPLSPAAAVQMVDTFTSSTTSTTSTTSSMMNRTFPMNNKKGGEEGRVEGVEDQQ